MYFIAYTKKARDDIPVLKSAGLDKRAKALIELIRENPYQPAPGYEMLKGSLSGVFSRRINIRHRLLYQVIEEEKTVKILRLWTQ